MQELIDGNYAIQIQQRNPKKAGTKSALLYDQYKGAERAAPSSIRDMLATRRRHGRADIPYRRISHGWVTLVDPTLQKRFSPPPTAAAPDPPSKEAVEAEDDDEGPPDDPMEEDSENDESREDVLKTLPPRPPPARARSRGAAVNYADPLISRAIIVSELRLLVLLGLVLGKPKPDALRQLDVLLGAARDAGLLLLFK